ncbi:MAG: restriction endonuclease subunit S [Acidimicrobiia bacterium]|nr:restriction endonuclease subunit S [Acidimicrobiia bacterium]
MRTVERKPLGKLLRRPPRYGINAAAVPLDPGAAAYIRITDIDESGRFAPNPKVGVGHQDARHYRLGPGELVFARTGASVGKSYLYDQRDGELVYAGFLINIAPDPDRLNPKYLALFAQSKEYWDWVSRTSMRSGQPGVNGREYAQLPVPLPDIATQNAIAHAGTGVDDLIAGLEQMIAKKQAIKQGMMQELLTGSRRLRGFSGTWREVSAGDVGTFKGGSGFPVRYQGATSGAYAFYKVSDMSSRGNERIMRRANNYISDSQRKLMGAVVMPKNAIVFAKVGAAIFQERKRLLTQPSCIDNNMAALVVDSGQADVKFIRYALSNFKLGSLVATTAMPSLNGGQLRSIPLLMPPTLDEQRAIASCLTGCRRLG